MGKKKIVYPELTPELNSKSSWRLLKYFGAGAIIASVTIGSGETLFASRSGAIFGYALLWCFVSGSLMKGVQVYTASRYMTLTGEHPVTHWAFLPGPHGWMPAFIGLISILCIPFWMAGLPLILGQTINWIFSIAAPHEAEKFLLWSRIWATLTIVIAVTFTLLQSYSILEKVQILIISLLLLCVLGACFVSNPDWLSVLMGSLTPSVPVYEEWLVDKYQGIASRPEWIEVVIYMGAIGGGTYDYIGYISCLREKKWGALGLNSEEKLSFDAARAGTLPIDTTESNVRRGLRWLLPTKVDTSISFLCVLIFATCFVLLGAVILHPQELVPAKNELLMHQAQFLTDLHPSLLYVYQIGIFMAFWGTIYGAYEVHSRSVYECLIAISRRMRQRSPRCIRSTVVLYSAVSGMIMLWTFEDPIALVTPAAIVGGVLMCGVWCFAMIWTDRRFLPKPLQMGKLLLVVTFVSGIALTLIGCTALWQYIANLWG